MRNLTKYPRLTSLNTSNNGRETTLIYINGIAKGKGFDRNGMLLKNSSNQQVVCTVDNFSSSLTRAIPNGSHDEIYIKVNTTDYPSFDYTGLAVIGDEVVWIKRDIEVVNSISGVATGENEIKLRVIRSQNNTVSREYPKGTIIRSVVNITDSLIGFTYESKSEVSNSDLFKPVTSSGNITMTDNIQRWSSFLSQSEFKIKKELPIYIFQGTYGEMICDYVGFIIDFDLDAYTNEINISFENKFSLYLEEKIKNNKVYTDISIKKLISEVLDIPLSMITYPIGEDGFPLYVDDDFFIVDVLSLKDFDTYRDFIEALCKEMCIRISFDANEKLVIQSDIKKFNKTSSKLKKYRYIRNSLGNQKTVSGNFKSGIKNWIELSIYDSNNKVIPYSNVSTNTTPYDVSQNLNLVVNNDTHDVGYKSSESSSIGYITIDLGSSKEISNIKMWHNYGDNAIYSNNILEISVDGKDWTTIFNSDVDGEYNETENGKNININVNKILPVASLNETDDFFTINSKTSDKIIINKIDGSFVDRQTYYNKQDFLYSNSKFNSVGEADINGDYDIIFVGDIYYMKEVVSTSNTTCELQWVNKGKYSSTEIVQQVKYSIKKKLSNIQVLHRNSANQPEFNVIEVVVGSNIKYFKIGKTYAMLTDGVNDFMCKVADIIVDANNADNSKIVLVFGYDPDKDLNYFGRVDYLDSIGYSNKKEYYMYYGRTEYMYISEWEKAKESDNTTSVNFPLVSGETYEITGKFGGIDTPDGKFNGMIQDLDEIYGIFTKTDLEYSREFHTEKPIYIRANSFVPNKTVLKYGDFDNSGLAVSISRNYENKESEFSFVKATDQTIYNSENDYISKFINTKFGYSVKAKDIISTGSIPANTILTTLNWTEAEIKDVNNKVWDNYKVQYNSTVYFIKKNLFDVVRPNDIPTRTFGIGIQVSDASTYNIGDVLMLSKSNSDNVNTRNNYNMYNDARWIIKSVDTKENILILDFEYPEGLNNAQLSFDVWEAKYILVLQEFRIKGNPYIDIVSTFFNEDTNSINTYGEKEYSGITGKFIKQADLEEATSYLLDGFGGTRVENTKSIIPFTTNMRYDIDVLDMIKVTDRISTGYDEQEAVVISKKVSSKNGALEVEYKAMTVGKYNIMDDLITTTNFKYAPSVLPVYSHDKSAGGDNKDNIDLSNSQISKFDNNIGSVSLRKINTNLLLSKIGKDFTTNDKIIELGNFTSMLTDDKRKRYTDVLLTKGKDLFIKLNEEFLYVKCISVVSDANKVVMSAKLEIKTRGVFKTISSSVVSSGTAVELYQITQISGANGLYSTGSTFGDIENREYFKFDIEDGVGLETSRGHLNIATEADWVNSLKTKFGLNDSMSKDEVLDYTGRGLLQIGDSRGSSALEDVWDLMIDKNIPVVNIKTTPYIVNKASEYNTADISEIKFRFELDSDWVEVVVQNNAYDLTKFEFPETETALNEVCTIKSIRNSKGNFNLNKDNVKGKFEIWSGNYSGNKTTGISEGLDTYYDVNDSPTGTNNGHGCYQVHNLDDSEVIFAISHIFSNIGLGIGNDTKKGSSTDYTTNYNAGDYTHRRLAIYVKRNTMSNDLGYIRYTRRGGLEVKGNIAVDSGSIKINDYTKNNFANLSDEKGIIGIGTNGSASIPASTKSYLQVGDNSSNNYMQFDGSNLILKSTNISVNDSNSNNYISFTNLESKFVMNKNGASLSKFQIGSFGNTVISSQNHIYYDGVQLQMRFNKGAIGNSKHSFLIDGNTSKLTLNSGGQQIGTNIVDSSTPDGNSGYSGFYFGDINSSGIGQLSTGRYLKYDGTTFQIGESIKMYKGEIPITDLNKLVEHSMDELLKGTTTIAGNVLKVYGDGKFTNALTASKNVQVHNGGNTNIINLAEFGHSGTFGNISNIADIDNLGVGKFIQLKNGSTVLTYHVDSIASDSSHIVLSSLIPNNLIYDLYIEHDTSAVVKMGDLRNTPDTGEYIRMGVGVDFSDKNSKGIKIIDDNKSNYFIFDTVSGFKIQTDGIVDIRNGVSGSNYKNRLYFKDKDSYMYMNSGEIQIGKFQSLPSGLQSTSGEGFLVGNRDSFLHWTDNTLKIKGNIDITGGATYNRLNGIDNNISTLSVDLNKVSGKAYISNVDPKGGVEWNSKNKPDAEHVGESWINPSTGVIKTFILDTVYKWIEVNTIQGIEANDNSKQKARIFISDLYNTSNVSNTGTIANTSDIWVVLNKEVVNNVNIQSPKTYIYSPKSSSNDGIPMSSTSLSDWILHSSDNTHYIDLSTGDSRLYFDNRINTVDLIEIAKTGSRGYFSVGNTNSDDHFYYSANNGQAPSMNISTTGFFKLSNSTNGTIENKIYFDSSKSEDVISLGYGAIQSGYVETIKSGITHRFKGSLITSHPSDINTADTVLFVNLDGTPNTSLYGGKRFFLKTNGNIELNGGNIGLNASSILSVDSGSINVQSNSNIHIRSGSKLLIEATSRIVLESNSSIDLKSSSISLNSSSAMNIYSGSSFNLNSDNVKIISSGEIMLHNDKNMLYFKRDGVAGEKTKSMFQMNCVENSSIFQIGETSDASYIAYDGANLSIGGRLITENSAKTKRTILDGGAIRFSEKNSAGNYVETTAIRKMAFGVANHGDIINLLNESNNIPWNNPAVMASITSVSTDGDANMRSLRVEARKIDAHRYKIDVTSSTLSLNETVNWLPNKYYNTSSVSQVLSHTNLFRINGELLNTVYVKYRVVSQLIGTVTNAGSYVVKLHWKKSSSGNWSSKTIASYSATAGKDTGYITVPTILDPNLEGLATDMYVSISGNAGKSTQLRYQQSTLYHRIITRYDIQVGRKVGQIVSAQGGTATWLAFEQ